MTTSAERVIARTAERLAKGLVPKYRPKFVVAPEVRTPLPCVHLGEPTGERRACRSCGGNVEVKVMVCALHGTCTPGKKVDGVRFCGTCPDREVLVMVPELPALNLSPKSDRAVVTVAAGEEGRSLLDISRPWMEQYAARENADFVILDWQGHKGWGQSSKFLLPKVLDFYERVVYLDADTLSDAEKCPSLFDMVRGGEFGIYNDLPGLTAGGHDVKFMAEYRRVCGTQDFPDRRPTFYGNTGVMVFDRSHGDILAPPGRPIPPLHCSEQHLWVARLQDTNVKFLPAACNYQWWEHGEEGFHKAPPGAILHFSGLRPRRTSAERLGIMKRFLREDGR